MVPVYRPFYPVLVGVFVLAGTRLANNRGGTSGRANKTLSSTSSSGFIRGTRSQTILRMGWTGRALPYQIGRF